MTSVLNKKEASAQKILNVSLLSLVTLLGVQAYLILVAENVFSMPLFIIWDDGSIYYANLTLSLIVASLSLLALISHTVFYVNLYKLIEGRINRKIFIASAIIGIVFIATLPMYFIRIHESWPMLILFVVSFLAIIVHRILLVKSLGKIFHAQRKLVMLSALFKSTCLAVLLPILAFINWEYLRDKLWWLFSSAWNIFFLREAAFAREYSEGLPGGISLFSWPITLANLLTWIDLALFSAIMIISFWNLPQRLAIKEALTSEQRGNQFSISHHLQNFKNEFGAVILRAFNIHVSVFVLCLVLSFVPIGIPTAIFILVSFSMYVFLGYKYLAPVADERKFPLFFLAGFLAMTAWQLHIFSLVFYDNFQIFVTAYAYFNYPAFAFAQIALLIAGVMLEFFGLSKYFTLLTMFVSALIPSVLMYLGVRAKKRQLRRPDY